MKKIVEKIKSSKKLILGILIGALTINVIEFVVTLAASAISSDIVLYNSSTGKKNVKDAIDELYTMASTHCPDGYECVQKKPCKVTSGTRTTQGSIITCGTESFYLLSNNGTNAEIFPKYNITLSTNPVQSASAGTTDFGRYWQAQTGPNSYEWKSGYGSTNFIYDSNSKLYPYVEAYKTKLQNLGINVINATLISEARANELVVTRKYTWAYNQAYWTGENAYSPTAPNFINTVHLVNTDGSIACGNNNSYPCNTSSSGIRPILTISSSSIQQQII